MLGAAEPLWDVLDPARANALLATLGREARLQAGDPLPPFFHQIYFWDAQPPERLGRDGHPAVGLGLVPDTGLPRRMWAGGALEFLVPLRVGERAEKRSFCLDVTHKTGRTGPLAFVTLSHEIWQAGQLCLRERQDLVYREDPDPNAPLPDPVAPEQSAEARSALHFDETVLFRYSALTFNGHRIHYDVDYARAVEGYAGLVVHGPLLAQHMMLAAEQASGDLQRFEFRGMAPLTLGRSAEICWNGSNYWVESEGALIMRGRAL